MFRKLCYLVGVICLVLSMTPDVLALNVTFEFPWNRELVVRHLNSLGERVDDYIEGPRATVNIADGPGSVWARFTSSYGEGSWCEQSFTVSGTNITFTSTDQCDKFSLNGTTITYIRYFEQPPVVFHMPMCESLNLYKGDGAFLEQLNGPSQERLLRGTYFLKNIANTETQYFTVSVWTSLGDGTLIATLGQCYGDCPGNFSVSGGTITYKEYIPVPEVTFEMGYDEGLELWTYDWKHPLTGENLVPLIVDGPSDTVELRNGEYLLNKYGNKQYFNVSCEGVVTLSTDPEKSTPGFGQDGNTIVYNLYEVSLDPCDDAELWESDWQNPFTGQNLVSALILPGETFLLQPRDYFFYRWNVGKGYFSVASDGSVVFDAENSDAGWGAIGNVLGFSSCLSDADCDGIEDDFDSDVDLTDCDNDGIGDACEESDINVLCQTIGAIIDAQVPPIRDAYTYKNHGAYVSKVAHLANTLVAAECHLSDKDAEDLHSCLVSTRAKSDVGKK